MDGCVQVYVLLALIYLPTVHLIVCMYVCIRAYLQEKKKNVQEAVYVMYYIVLYLFLLSMTISYPWACRKSKKMQDM